jgi:hypothetical protein
MAPDEIIDPPPAWARDAWVAGTPPGYMNAARRACAASTHTPPPPHPDRTVTTDADNRGPLLFGASLHRAAIAPESRNRIGWSLVVMCLAETIVTVAAIAAGDYVTGLVAVWAMALCGIILVAAESASVRRSTTR